MTKWKVVESQAYMFEHDSTDHAEALDHFRLNRSNMESQKFGRPAFSVVVVQEKEVKE